MARVLIAIVATWVGWVSPVYAVPLDALDSNREWRVEKINLLGNKLISGDDLRAELLTKERPWYLFWGERPTFDPVTFESDIERLRRYYEARGYYDIAIDHDIAVDEDNDRVTLEIRIKETQPVIISAVDVAVVGDLAPSERPALPETLPVKSGGVFRESDYQLAEERLRDVFLRGGFAYVETTRKAEVDIEERQVKISYTIAPGPPTVFGDTEIRGLDRVDRSLIERELAYRGGERFSSEKIAATRAKILSLDLFSSVTIGPAPTSGKPTAVPIAVEVMEKPYREIRIGVGYNTEEEFRGQLQWRHLNWFGGGRQVVLQGAYSAIAASATAELIQPHFLTPLTKAVLPFKYEQQKEETFDRNFSRFAPRVDHRFSPTLSGFLGFRAEYDDLFDIAPATERALGDVRKEGGVFGPAMGVVWNTTDSPFDPKKGAILSLLLEQAGVIWGGAYRFFKITGEAKRYYEIGWDTVFAARLKLGIGDALGAKDRFPIFERFYAGGANSVRGYGRGRLGPLSASDDPLGGLSLLEGSIELRRPIWKEIGGALFVDFGQLALRPFDAHIFNLNFSAGFGLSYKTPVGPVRLDVGFPFQKPPKDKPWQIHFSIGAFF